MKTLWQFCGRAAFWLSWPALWVYLGGTKRTRVIITSGDKVLLVKSWLSTGQWKLPGGGIYRKEDPAAAAAREVLEETGIKLRQATYVQDLAVKEYGFKFHCKVFRAELKRPAAIKRQKLEVVEVAWVPLQELQNLSPLTAWLLQPLV